MSQDRGLAWVLAVWRCVNGFNTTDISDKNGENDSSIFLWYELQCSGKNLLHVGVVGSWGDVQALF